MGSNSKIEWTQATWNPITGCSKVSEGCANCYAKRMAKRLAGRFGYPKDDPFRVTLHPDRLDQPFGWKKPKVIFVCSMGDLFHEDLRLGLVEWERVFQIYDIMMRTDWHTYLVLTKRPENARYFYREWIRPHDKIGHIWVGVTAENQKRADERIPILLQIPAAIRFVSLEPLLSEIDLDGYLADHEWEHGVPGGINWVIVGGESGPGARPMAADWVRKIRDDCVQAGVPFFFKQWGGVDKKKAGRLLDGRTWDEIPGNKELKGGT